MSVFRRVITSMVAGGSVSGGLLYHRHNVLQHYEDDMIKYKEAKQWCADAREKDPNAIIFMTDQWYVADTGPPINPQIKGENYLVLGAGALVGGYTLMMMSLS